MVSIAAVAAVASTGFLVAVVGVMAYFAFSMDEAGARAAAESATASDD